MKKINSLNAKKRETDVAQIILENLDSIGAEDIDEKKFEEERLYKTHNRVKLSLSCIMLFFFILNLYKGDTRAAFGMGIGTIVMFCTYIIMVLYPQTHLFQKWFLIIGCLVFFISWVTSGGYRGFGLFWTIIFPPMIIYMTNKRTALRIISSGFLVIVFLLWTPLNQYIYQYDPVIRQRYPFLYLCMFGIALLIKSEQEQSDAVRNSMIKTALVYKKKAEQASIAKGEFLSRMSHEIRTPINAIMGMDELILREEDNPEIIGYANDIKNASDTLLALINDILDFSKIETGKIEIIPVEYSIAELIHDCYSTVAMQMKEKGLVFEATLEESLPSKYKGDEIRIRQIITNLLTNAYKYTETGSVILKVRATQAEIGRVVLSFSVKDTGIGIKEEHKNDIFDSFSRVDQKNNRNIEGTGLGLAISKQLATAMGGDIDVISEYGIGTEFIVSIPQAVIDTTPIGANADITKDRRKAGKKQREKIQLPKAHILVVDDVEMNLKIVERLLKGTEVTVDLASSGQECLEKCENIKYDIILMDQMMPIMDGVTTMNKLRASGGINSNIPIVVLTADAIEGAKEEYLRIGFSDYLSKPIRPSELERALKQKLES